MNHISPAFCYLLLMFWLHPSGHLICQEVINMEILANVRHDDTETNDIWGYVAPDGTEYAVVGTFVDCRIYDLSDPSAPRLTARVPGATSVWRDFKSYGTHLYGITDQGNDGIRIIDMTKAPDTVTSITFKPMLTIDGQERGPLSRCHNVYIDTTRGHLFVMGCRVGSGAVLMFDIATDPMDPKFIGRMSNRYSHDAVTRGDTLFSSEINQGNLGIYDISDPTNPSLIQRQETTSSFTHNAWHSTDGRYIFTTDERANSNVDAYDIQDINSPQLIDTYQPKPGQGIIPHNTHYHDGYLVTSWYTEGVIIVDAHRPDNLVRVAQYDTYPQNGSGFNGCWGAYPWLPSGLVLASDLSNGLFVLKADYKRAAYLEGNISDASTGIAINGAIVELLDGYQTKEVSDALGVYKTGTADAGTYQIRVSHPNYEPAILEVTLTSGEVTLLDIRLDQASQSRTVVGQVLDTRQEPIPFAKVLIRSDEMDIKLTADDQGYYKTILLPGAYDIYAASWGYQSSSVLFEINTDEDGDEVLAGDIILSPGYADDFFVDLGWTVSGDAAHGGWDRVIPVGTSYQGNISNPDMDVSTDMLNYCYVTGNDARSVGADDVDDGTTILTSPAINVDTFRNPMIEYSIWYFNSGGDGPINDTMYVYLLAEDQKKLVETVSYDPNLAGWRAPTLISVDSFFFREKEVHISFESSDLPGTGHLVEAGVDQFRLYEGPLPQYPQEQPEIDIVVAPNPNSGLFYVDAKTDKEMTSLRIFDRIGRRVAELQSPSFPIDVSILSSGLYFIEATFSNGTVSTEPWIKVD